MMAAMNRLLFINLSFTILRQYQSQHTSFTMDAYKEFVVAGIVSLNNHPLDFDGNLKRILESIQLCKNEKCTIRVGGELEITGYSCQDHFLESDTLLHSWEVVSKVISSGLTEGIFTDLGMPILHSGVLYNCRIVILNSKIVGIRPKMVMANDGNHFESRWFSSWKPYHSEEHYLPEPIKKLTGQVTVPIGHLIFRCHDTDIGYEICEEAWVSKNLMIEQSMSGCEIFLNPSGSHVEQGKLYRKIQLVEELTEKNGGAYLYSNIRGSEGTRVYFDGGCFFSINGKVKALTPLFSLSDVCVMRVEFSLCDIKNYRLSKRSNAEESSKSNHEIRRVNADIHLGNEEQIWDSAEAKAELDIHRLAYINNVATLEPSCWLWDYLKKSGASGLFLPLSGGVDSGAVALVVFNMCRLLVSESRKASVLSDLRKVLRDPTYVPSTAQELCNKILFTAYLATENSSQTTRNLAQNLSKQINCSHRYIDFNDIFQQFKGIGKQIVGEQLKFQFEGGTSGSDLCLQNVQARTRMVLSYLLSSLELQNLKKEGFLLVLSSSNLDESLRGYMTKYDCSSGDINPIGSMSKTSVRDYLIWNMKQNNITSLSKIVQNIPTAELRPMIHGKAQSDEEDMGITYDQIRTFGYLRKTLKCGPVSMFQKVCKIRKELTIQEVAIKVKCFFKHYGANRHKMNTVTPSMHFQPTSCDDNRFDMRPILYISDWKAQFDEIDRLVALEPYKKSRVWRYVYET